MIPTKPGGLGEILTNAPLLLERLATLTERLTLLLSDENQASISGILANTERLTDNLADASPQLERTLAEMQATLRQANMSLAAFEKTMQSTDALLSRDGSSLATQLRETLKSAKLAADSLQVLRYRYAARCAPAFRNARCRRPRRPFAICAPPARRCARSPRSSTIRAPARLLGGSKLPDYKP